MRRGNPRISLTIHQDCFAGARNDDGGDVVWADEEFWLVRRRGARREALHGCDGFIVGREKQFQRQF